MKHSIIRTAASSAAIAVLALGGAAPALGAKHRHRSHARKTTARARETPLTGSTLSSASAAAISANPGATVNGASTETDSSTSGAAYEVHITKADGTHAVVIEDSSFNVLATQARSGHGPRR